MYNKISMNRIISTTFLVTMLMLPAQTGWAQHSYLERKPNEDIGQINSHITQLLEDNRSLTAERDRLKEEAYILQSKVDHAEKKFGKLEKDAFNERATYQMDNKSLAILNGDTKELQNEIMIRKSRQTFLKGQVLDLDKKINLWNLKKKQLDYEKREYEIEQKTQNSEFSESQLQRTYRQLERDVKESEARKQEILDQMAEIEEARSMYPHGIINMKNENARMAQELESVKVQKTLKDKEISILQDKKHLAQLQYNRDFSQYDQEHEHLKKKVSRLEKEYKQLNETVDESLSNKSKKRSIMQNIINLDKENQDLMDEISQLQKTLQEQ